jgi:endonuclease/exonuclease/phosphatase family metal-dependent hydrolase
MKRIGAVLIFFSIFETVYAQEPLSTAEDEIQIIFWNVENLFDTEDDSLKNDEEFLPYSMRGWNRERYQKKLFSLYKTLVAAGQWKLPEIIALAEVENEKVLQDLIEKTPLFRAGYQIIHQESEDRRGIDLAVLYRPERLQMIDTNFIRLNFPDDPYRKTRDILYLKAQATEEHDFHLFVNHWPSRYGGGKASEKGRIYAASVVKAQVDSLLTDDSNASIIVTGDFNDTPDDLSLNILAGNATLHIISHQDFAGTHKFQGLWNHFDQVWVSNYVLQSMTLYAKDRKAEVFHPDWLLETDKAFGGVKPNRTYEGFRYHGGYSDHLPVFIELKMKPTILSEKED